MPNNISEQLKQLYDHYRTSLLNRKYYAHQLTTTKKCSFAIELILAIANSTAIASWVIWKQSVGAELWLGITGVAAIAAIIKPLLHWDKEIERYSKLYMTYTAAYLDLKDIVEEVATAKTFSDETYKEFKAIHKKIKEQAGDDDISPSKELLRLFQKEVNEEIPVTTLWIPA